MNKILRKFWNDYCQPAMRRTVEELADSQTLMQAAKSVADDYERRRQQKISADAELASKFQRLFDNSLIAMSFYDKDGRLIDLNDKMRKLCAIDIFGDDYFRNTSLFDTPSFQGDFDPQSKDPFCVCQHMYFPDLGIDRYIEVRVQPIFDAKGQFKYYVITSRDISNEREIYLKQAAITNELAANSQVVGEYEMKLNYLLRSSNMFVWWLDFSTRRISFTRSLKKQEFSESIDDYLESIYDDERQQAIDHMKQLLQAPHTFNLKHHFRYTPANPNPQWLYINGQPVFDSQGKVIALFGILRDVTTMMETQQQLLKEQHRAEASAIMKSAFLANMSHEIRTPLNAIVGFSDLLQVVDEPAERQEFIRIIRNNSDMLLRLINDIIEVSDMGQTIAIEPTDVDFAQLFNDICQTLDQRVQESGVEFIKENPYETCPATLDKGRVQQIITNFVSNAIKHTHEGHIRVGYKIIPAPPAPMVSPALSATTSSPASGVSGGFAASPSPASSASSPSSPSALYVYCEDTGAGIPKDKQQAIFQRFVKLNDHVQGTGIGLSICKTIVERCQGGIGVDSEGEGHGSTFWFWLPIKKLMVLIAFICLIPTLASSQNVTDNTASAQFSGSESGVFSRIYDEEHPLVYEDAWDLWPYAFLNDTGEPVGYNIDLLRLIFKELDIPYRIKLKPTQDALNDLKAGRADLMCGMEADFHNEYAQYGKSVIQIFTHSVVHRKDEPVLVKTVDDLANQRVIVHTGSFSHHLMTQRGWGKNAIPYNDMQEAVQFAHNEKGNQIVWNTLSLSWLLHKFKYDDLELTPVNIPHGKYKFMSNDAHLMEQMDSVFAILNSTGRLQPIQNKWFYPERKETGIPSWVWYIVLALLLVILVFLVYYLFYRLYERRMTKSVRRSNNRLSLILNTSKVYIWLFDIAKRTVTSIGSGNKSVTIPLSPYFFQYYLQLEDYERMCRVLDEIAAQKKEREKLEIHAVKEDSKEMYIFSVDFSVMRGDRSGRPTVIIGAITDITADRLRQQQQKDMMLRYRHIFNSAMVDTVSYDENGYIDDLNEKAARVMPEGVQSVVDKHISVQSVLGDPELCYDNMEYTYLTQIYKSPDDPRPLNQYLHRDELYYELQLVPIRDDDGRLLGIYGTGRDVTEVAKSYSRLQKNIAELQEATDELQDYIRNIDYVMQNGGVRIVNYSPDTHTLTIYSEIERVQYRLTQTRLLSLVAEDSKKTAQRILNNMDNLTQQPVKAVVKSILRVKGGKQLYLSFSFVPVFATDGRVTYYFGMCRDISDIKATEEQLARETQKAQEVETVKNVFLRNMCYEIRTPLNSVVGFAELIEKEHQADDEQFFIEEIKKNSRVLLNLVNNILFLSRLDAGMIELKTAPVDFAGIFEGRCQSAWLHCRQPGVDYIVDTPYERLVLDIDLTNLGVVIDHIATNAAQHTTSGYVRARFDYNGEDLTVAIQDTGCGIPADQLDKIFERFVTTDSSSSGLGLPICQEVIKLMGGRMRVKSELGKGTIVWIIIPCTCMEVVRK